jgi:hypothetical protein
MRHKLIGYGLLLFVVFYIVHNPAGAAATAGHIGSGLAGAGSAVGDFIGALFDGGAS